MAAVAHTVVVEGIPLGQYYLDVYRTSALGTGAQDEWIATGRSKIISVLGCVVIGAVDPAGGPPHVAKNARGSNVSEDTNPGDLGIEVEDATTNIVEIACLVRP